MAEGGITADRVIIAGTVKGPVHARESLELQAQARIEGDIQYVALEMHHGATISGQLRPVGPAAAASEQNKTSIRLATKSA